MSSPHELHLLATALFLVGGILFIAYFPASAKSKRMKTWPTTPGKITRSQVIESRTSQNHLKVYDFKIEYYYTVAATPYVGNRLSPVESYTGNRAPADALTQKYPLNSEHPVFYNPRKPQDSYLNITYTGTSLILLFAFILLFTGFLLTLLALPK